MQLIPASQFTLAERTRLWNLGYDGYFVPVQFTEAQMGTWTRCADFDLDHSLVLVDGDGPAGFSYLGVRGTRGWIGGFGITPEFRGKGLAYTLFADHVAHIRSSMPLTSVQLEVLVENWAWKVYARAGFAKTRRLTVLQGTLPAGGSSGGVRQMAAPALLSCSERLHEAAPAVWQREPAWLTKSLTEQAQGLVIGPEDAPVGMLLCLLQGESVRIMDAAALGQAEAGELVQALARLHPGRTVTLVNEPEDSPIHQALTDLGCAEVRAQWEMRLAL